MLDIECRHRSIMLAKKQILALSNHKDSNRMNKTDDSSFRHYQRPSNNICVFKRFLFWILDGTNQAIGYGGTWIWSSRQVNNIGKEAVDFLRFRTKMISTKKLIPRSFGLEGNLPIILQVEKLMEAFRPMFPERHENIRMLQLGINSKFVTFVRIRLRFQPQNRGLLVQWFLRKKQFFKSWLKESSQKFETYLNFDEMTQKYWRFWLISTNTISVPESNLFTLKSRTPPRKSHCLGIWMKKSSR